MSFPLDIQRIYSLLEDNTTLMRKLLALQEKIDDEDVVNTFKRLGIISGRLGLIVSCNDIPGMEKAIAAINVNDEELFMDACEEYQYQISQFFTDVEKQEHE